MVIEFLNNTRNANKYPKDDPLAPARIPITYTSAITLAAQPLAWMEVSNLKEIDALQKQLATYKKISNALHSCIILPIGKEPNGLSNTGSEAFQNNTLKYILWYRELSEQNLYTLPLPGLKPNMTFNRVLSDLSMDLDQKNPYTLKIGCLQSFSYGLFSID